MPGPYSVVVFSCLIIPQTGLQYNAILKDRNLAEALLLGTGLLAGGNIQHQPVQVGAGLIQRALTIRDHTGVEVDPSLFLGSQLAAKKKTWIDFNAGVVADGERTLDEAGADLYRLVLDIASGKQTCAEKKGFREISIFKDGVVL